MKLKTLVQANGNELCVSEAEGKVREILKEKGYKITHIDSLEVYLKPIENEAYYVAKLKDGEEIKDKVAFSA